jgi:peptidoglycan/LPS O-acetylase OafA/YrhL
MRERQFFHNLDALRGLCALLVALFHAVWASHFRGLPLILNGWLFVDFFFVLSGFVIAHTYWSRLHDWTSVGNFVVRRFFRLYPIHILTFATCFGAVAIGQHFQAVHGTAAWRLLFSKQALQTILLIQDLGATPSFNEPSWSISAEFWTYLIFAAEMIAASRTRVRVALISLVGAAGFAFIYILNFPHGLFTAVQFGFPRCIAGFALGALVNLIWLRTRWRPSRALANALLGGLFVACLVVLSYVTEGNPWNCVVLPLFAVIVFVSASDPGSWFKKVLELGFMRTLGRVSYSMYMVHTTVLIVVSFAITRLAPQLKHGQVAGASSSQLLLGDGFCVLYLIIIVAVSLAAFHMVEDPCRRLGNRLSKHIFPIGDTVPTPAESPR